MISPAQIPAEAPLSFPMIVNKDFANTLIHLIIEGGDTGKIKAEHRNFTKVGVHSLYRNW
jgi:hypothetical protein